MAENTASDYESEPLTRSEYITALSHLYRGEMHRSLVWRSRLDTTTHWSILATLAILTFSFQNPGYSQEILIAGMYANLVFLIFEARRFRFFDVWRSRVRMIEENFYGPVLRRDLRSPIDHWGRSVADDLLHPKFKITLLQALRARFMRGYVYVFGFLLAAWLGRIVVFQALADDGLTGLFGIGNIPWWGPVSLVAVLYLCLLGIVFFTPKVQPPEKSYWPDPEHTGKDVPSLDV